MPTKNRVPLTGPDIVITRESWRREILAGLVEKQGEEVFINLKKLLADTIKKGVSVFSIQEVTKCQYLSWIPDKCSAFSGMTFNMKTSMSMT